ncbi:hypothetical protein C8R45DRAFT_822816, partial [Mycena sanguinolenta]
RLKDSSKAPNMVEIEHRGLHQCVANNVIWDPDWTHDGCTAKLIKLFPGPFEWLSGVGETPDWVLLSKAYKDLHVVPKLQPTGLDAIKYRIPKNAKSGNLLFIGDVFLNNL